MSSQYISGGLWKNGKAVQGRHEQIGRANISRADVRVTPFIRAAAAGARRAWRAARPRARSAARAVSRRGERGIEVGVAGAVVSGGMEARLKHHARGAVLGHQNTHQIDLRARGLHHLRPLLRFRGDELSRTRPGGWAARNRALRQQPLLERRRLERLFAVSCWMRLTMSAEVPAGASSPNHELASKPFHARLGDRRQVGHGGAALCARHRDRLELAGLDLRAMPTAGCRTSGSIVAADQVEQRRARAAVREVQHVGAGHALEKARPTGGWRCRCRSTPCSACRGFAFA